MTRALYSVCIPAYISFTRYVHVDVKRVSSKLFAFFYEAPSERKGRRKAKKPSQNTRQTYVQALVPRIAKLPPNPQKNTAEMLGLFLEHFNGWCQ